MKVFYYRLASAVFLSITFAMVLSACGQRTNEQANTDNQPGYRYIEEIDLPFDKIEPGKNIESLSITEDTISGITTRKHAAFSFRATLFNLPAKYEISMTIEVENQSNAVIFYKKNGSEIYTGEQSVVRALTPEEPNLLKVVIPIEEVPSAFRIAIEETAGSFKISGLTAHLIKET